MTTTVNINGSITISDMIDNHLVSHTYYGFSMEVAKQLFLDETEKRAKNQYVARPPRSA